MSSDHIETEAKKAGETITVPFDFTSRLAADEEINSVDAEVSVFSGVDSAPSAILAGSPENDDPIVHQRITGGVAGTIYLVLMRASTDQDNELQLGTYIAIASD